MTLNQVIQRIKSLAESHKQIRSVTCGDIMELVQATSTLYPALNFDYSTGVIDWQNKQTFVSFQFQVLDLINVAEDTRTNEAEVLSDLLSIAQDMYAMISDYALQDDWTISEQVQIQFGKEKFQDMVGAVMFTIQISTDYDKNVCQVPIN